MRLFIAIPVGGGAAGALGRLQADLRTGRHVPPENLHLTLAFLGDQPVATAEAVHDELSEIALPGFALRLCGLGVVTPRSPRLVHAGVEPAAPLRALRDKVRGAVRAAGVPLGRERFRPHVTLARFPAQMPRHELDRLGGFLEAHGDLSVRMEAASFVFYRSHLGHEGPVYETLAEYPLTAPAA